MSSDLNLQFTLFVEHGREQEAANFYTAAFGAERGEAFYIEGALAGMEMRFGSTTILVAGANPNREREPSRGGPFFPKSPGDVRTLIQFNVCDLDSAFQRALNAGATVRYDIDDDTAGGRSACLFDPFGHIWGFNERKMANTKLAA